MPAIKNLMNCFFYACHNIATIAHNIASLLPSQAPFVLLK